MPQIPRQFLQRPQQGSIGRRERQIARTQPGVADQVNAVIAATRGLDMTPIGEALYKTGSHFERMERERIGAEDELRKMKQMSAARSVIINTTQKIHDAYAEIQTQNLSDPEQVRNLFHQRVQAVMDEDQESLDAIGEYAFEPYTRHITETMTTLQPKLTAQAIGNSRTMLEEQLREQRRSAVQVAATIEDDDEAAKVGDMVLGGILDESYPFLSDMDKMAQAKAFMAELTTARFRKKWSDNPKGALAYLDAQTGVDPEARHKIYAEVVSEASQFNAAIENQQQAQDRQQDQLQEDRFREDFMAITAAIQNKDINAQVKALGDLSKNPHAYKPQHLTMLTSMVTDSISGKGDGDGGPSDAYVTFKHHLASQSLHHTESWFYTNVGQFNNKERIMAMDDIASMKTKEGQASVALEKGIHSRLTDRLLALQILSPDALIQADAAPGGREQLMRNLSSDAKEKLAMMERDLRTAVNGERYLGSQNGNNYAGLQKNAGIIEDQIFRQYEQAFKNPKSRPLPFAMDLRKAQGMMVAGQLPPADFQNMYVNYLTNQKAKDPNYDPKNDPQLVEFGEAYKQSKEGAKGAAGARDMEPAKEQPEPKPVHAGIIPDLPPVGRMEPARTIGKRIDTDEKFQGLVDLVGIGAQSAAEESGGNPAIIGDEPDGTKSYGMFQINQVNIPEFLTFLKSQGGESEARKLAKAKPGSREFGQAWQKVAEGEAFNKAQRAYAEQEFYGPARDEFERRFSVKAGDMPLAIQMALFSAGIQHGGVKKVIKLAADKIGETRGASPQEILQALYEARTEYVQGLGSLDEGTKQSLVARYQREYKRGLNYLG